MDLASLIAQEGALSPAQVADLALRLGAELDRVHAAGMVHGDLSAGSVLLPGPGTGARVADAERSGPESAIAPEQILGQPIDRRADVYALACVMYEALVGCEPFVRDSADAARQAHLADERPRASEHGAAVGTRVDDVLRRGMARDPAARHASAGAFARDLAATLVTSAPGAGPRWAAPALGLVLLAFGAAGAWAWLGRDEPEPRATDGASPTTLTRTSTVAPADATGPAPAPPPLARVHRAEGGLQVRYPAGWRVRSSPRRRAGSTVEFEYLTLASGPFRRAPMYLRVVVGGRADAAFFGRGNRARLLGKARASARSAFAWTTSFRGETGLRVAGAAGRRADLVWQVERGYAGLGFAFAGRHGDGRWLYGFALYDTWDAGRVRAGRVRARRDTLRAVVSQLRWG